MKLTPRQVAGFLQKDWQHYPIIVLFGHADDIMRQHQKTLLKKAKVNLDDPFVYAHLSGEQIAQDPSVLIFEATSTSLSGEQRWITVRGKNIALDKAISSLCQPEMQERIDQNRLIIIIEGLTTKAALLRKISQCDFAAALPCYEAGPQNLIPLIQQFCEARHLRCTADGEAALLMSVNNNIDTLNQLLEKLSLYLGKEDSINQASVLACSDDAYQHNLQEFALIAFQGNAQETDLRLQNLLEQKTSNLAIIRMLVFHCTKLLGLQSQASIKGIDGAIKSAQPPIFFKQSQQFSHQCQHYTARQLQGLLGQLIEMEIHQKSGAALGNTHLRQWLLRLARRH